MTAGECKCYRCQALLFYGIKQVVVVAMVLLRECLKNSCCPSPMTEARLKHNFHNILNLGCTSYDVTQTNNYQPIKNVARIIH